MVFYRDFNLFSQFVYAKNHFIEGAKALTKTSASSTKVEAIGEMALGVLELTPVFGLFAAYLEKLLKNNTYEKRMTQRERFVNEQISSRSFALQSLYFDTQSSERLHNSASSYKEISAFSELNEEFHKLRDSYPDFQIFALINELTAFKETFEENTPEYTKIEDIISKLDRSKNMALLISEIMASYSTATKEALRGRLEALIQDQIQNMSVGESIIIPSGYMNGNIYNLFGQEVASGHSITVKLIKENDNSYTMRLYNTAGMHHDRDDIKANSVYPYIVKDISQESLLQGDFLNKFTKFSYSEEGRTNQEDKLYKLIRRLGTKVTDYSGERSYHNQGHVNNCTKKSLQTWLHEELRDEELTYRRFRSFKLQQTLNSVRPVLNNFWGMFYTVPLAAIGGLTTNKPLSIALKTLGFLFGSSVRRRISKDTITTLFWQAQNLAVIRSRKSQGEEVELKKLPTHLFMDPSIEVVISKILSKKTTSLNRPYQLEVLGAELAMGHSFQSFESDLDLDRVLNLLRDNRQKIAFLKGFTGQLVSTGNRQGAIQIAKYYEDKIRNIRIDDEDIITVYREIFPPPVAINYLSDLEKIPEYQEALLRNTDQRD